MNSGSWTPSFILRLLPGRTEVAHLRVMCALWKWLDATCGSVSSSALKGQRQSSKWNQLTVSHFHMWIKYFRIRITYICTRFAFYSHVNPYRHFLTYLLLYLNILIDFCLWYFSHFSNKMEENRILNRAPTEEFYRMQSMGMNCPFSSSKQSAVQFTIKFMTMLINSKYNRFSFS